MTRKAKTKTKTKAKNKPTPRPKQKPRDHLVKDFWVLSLSKGRTRLLSFSGTKLTEINDRNFPVRYEEQFQFEKKSGPPKVQYFDDESQTNQIRLHAYFRHVKHLLEPYLKAKDLPVVLLTVNTYQSDFKRVTRLDGHIMRSIHGNYDKHRVSELRTLLNKKLKLGIVDKRRQTG